MYPAAGFIVCMCILLASLGPSVLATGSTLARILLFAVCGLVTVGSWLNAWLMIRSTNKEDR